LESILLSLLILSIGLFILSVFLRDPYKELRDEMDQMSMQQIQEMYQIKKKLKVLEEELLVADEPFTQHVPAEPSIHSAEKREVHEIIKNQVILLTRQGLSVEQIARQSSLSPDEVRTIQTEMKFRGHSHE
jgi:polyribonucleotide nucleotidyltransferase